MSKELKTVSTSVVTEMPKKPYLRKVKRQYSFGVKEVDTSLIGYVEGQTHHYWTNMVKGQIVEAGTKKAFDHSKRFFIPFGWQSMWAVAYPPVKKDTNGKVLKDDNDNLIFEEKTYKSKGIFTLYGVWTDEKGNTPTEPTGLVSIDFKSYSATDLKALLTSKTKEFIDGIPVTLPLLRIKFGDCVNVGQTQKFTFQVEISKDFDFEYLANEWLKDVVVEGKTPMYNAESMQAIAQHNTSLNAIQYKASNAMHVLPPKNAFENYMPTNIERLPLNEGEFTLRLNFHNESKMLLENRLEDEEESEFELQ